MATLRNRRGSVLLMAIGLLTIIAILSSTFLIVSNLDSQETESLTVKTMADPVAVGALHKTIALIAEDRHANQQGPYGALQEGGLSEEERLKAYIDAPGGGEGDRIDEWLAPCGRSEASISTYWSRIYSDDANDAGRTDTDGDEVEDAWYYVFYDDADPNSREGKFKVAVRIVDLSAKVCVNTASDGDPNGNDPNPQNWLQTRSPALINLMRVLGSGYGAPLLYQQKIHPARCGVQAGQLGYSLRDYDDECGRRLLSPFTTPQRSYDPFAIGDEVFLLWCEPLAYDSPANVGRLYNAIGPYLKQLNVVQDANGYPLGDQAKRLLTTFSCTSAVVRRPDSAKELKELELLNVGNNEQGIYKRMKVMLAELGIAEETQCNRLASAFVSNLKAYLSPGREGAPWDFQPEGETFTTYGYKGDLVITEVVGKHKGPTEDDKDDGVWATAIELMNPTDEDMDLAEYQLVINGGTPITLKGSVPAGREGASYTKRVLWHLEKGDDAQTTMEEFLPGITNHDGGDLGIELDFAGGEGGSVRLELVHNENGHAVPVDSSEFTYSRPQPLTLNAEDMVCMQRDDRYEGGDANSAGWSKPLTRYLLPRHTSVAAHTLGAANSVTGGAEHAILFHSVERPGSGQQLNSVGELCNIYLAAPASGEGVPESEKTFGQQIIKEEIPIFKDTYTRGKMALADANTLVDAGGLYPALPPGCLYAEFFTNVARHVRKKEQGRVYGRINVNTATREALLALPWPERIPAPELATGVTEYTTANGDFDPNLAVQLILDYRHNPGGGNFGVGSLRSGTQNLRAFLTPGEVAIPLAAYMRTVILGHPSTSGMTWDQVRSRPGTYEALHALYRSIADCITTRSDVFGIYIKVQYGEGGRYTWNYLAVVDRSNVLDKHDTPAILLFCEIQSAEDNE
jgi:hypothetical protein